MKGARKAKVTFKVIVAYSRFDQEWILKTSRFEDGEWMVSGFIDRGTREDMVTRARDFMDLLGVKTCEVLTLEDQARIREEERLARIAKHQDEYIPRLEDILRYFDGRSLTEEEVQRKDFLEKHLADTRMTLDRLLAEQPAMLKAA